MKTKPDADQEIREGPMTSMTAGAMPANLNAIDMAEMDECLRQFMLTAARYVMTATARPADRSRDCRISEK